MAKYSKYTDMFSLDLVFKLPENIRINNYTIKLIDSQQGFYELIYSLRLGELQTLKPYIKINLAKSFIKSFKSLPNTLIFFNQKSNKSF